jgi:thiol-disulfide isomerase/thioredoxin
MPLRKKLMRFLLVLTLTGPVLAQDVVRFDTVEKLLHASNDTTYVINFWATWCSPCVEELPHFESLRSRYVNEKLRIVLVSLDFKSQLNSKVKPFIEKKGLRSTVWLLDETDANSYIDKVSPEWSGAIPATLIVNHRRNVRSFYEKQMTLEELVSMVEPLIQ